MCDFDFEAVAPGPALAAFPCRSNTSLGVSDLSLRLSGHNVNSWETRRYRSFEQSLRQRISSVPASCDAEQNLHSGGSCKKQGCNKFISLDLSLDRNWYQDVPRENLWTPELPMCEGVVLLRVKKLWRHIKPFSVFWTWQLWLNRTQQRGPKSIRSNTCGDVNIVYVYVYMYVYKWYRMMKCILLTEDKTWSLLSASSRAFPQLPFRIDWRRQIEREIPCQTVVTGGPAWLCASSRLLLRWPGECIFHSSTWCDRFLIVDVHLSRLSTFNGGAGGSFSSSIACRTVMVTLAWQIGSGDLPMCALAFTSVQ